MKKERRNQGFTLVEGAIAMLVLAVGLGSVALTINMAMRWVSTNRTEMAAMHAARTQLEYLRTRTWSDAALAVGTHTVTSAGFEGSYTVTDAGTDLRDVALTIAWNSENRRDQATTTLTTTLTRALHN